MKTQRTIKQETIAIFVYWSNCRIISKNTLTYLKELQKIASTVLFVSNSKVNETEIEKGLDSELVDRITANIINERNPVCYGADRRWANHLYPIYVTESYLKSKYLGTNMFLNLF